MRDNKKTWSIITKIIHKRKILTKRTKEEEEKEDKDVCTQLNLLQKIRQFEKLDQKDKDKFLVEGQKSSNHGGLRK